MPYLPIINKGFYCNKYELDIIPIGSLKFTGPEGLTDESDARYPRMRADNISNPRRRLNHQILRLLSNMMAVSEICDPGYRELKVARASQPSSLHGNCSYS